MPACLLIEDYNYFICIIIKSTTALQCFWAIELDIMQLMCSASYGLTGNNDALDILITPCLLSLLN